MKWCKFCAFLFFLVKSSHVVVKLNLKSCDASCPNVYFFFSFLICVKNWLEYDDLDPFKFCLSVFCSVGWWFSWCFLVLFYRYSRAGIYSYLPKVSYISPKSRFFPRFLTTCNLDWILYLICKISVNFMYICTAAVTWWRVLGVSWGSNLSRWHS